MKTNKSMRRLVALTLATAVTLPQASPVFAASLKIGKSAEGRLEQAKLSTASNNKLQLTTKDRFPLLSLPKTFEHEISTVTPVTKMGMESSRSLSEKMGDGLPGGTTPIPIMVTDSNNKLQIVTKENDPPTETTDLVTEIDEGNDPSLLMAESPPGAGELAPVLPPESEGGETAVDNLKTVVAEGITDVTTNPPDEGDDPLAGDVVMPPDAGGEDQGGSSSSGLDAGDHETAEGEGTDPDMGQPSTPAEPPSDGEIQPDQGDILPAPEELPAAEDPALEMPEALAALDSQALARAVLGECIYDYSIGYGVPLSGSADYLGIAEYEKTCTDSRDKSRKLNYKFQVELPRELDTSSARYSYGSKIYAGGGLYDVYNGKQYLFKGKWVDSEEGYDLTWLTPQSILHSYCILPGVEALGRVPDKVFDGWYVYPAGKVLGTDVKGWSYDESCSPVKVDAYGPEDPDYDEDHTDKPGDEGFHDHYNYKTGYPIYGDNKDLGEFWDEAQDYEGYQSGDLVRIVAKWRGSDESRAADVTIIKDEKLILGNGTTPPSLEYTTMDSPVTLTAGGQRLQLYSGDIVGKYGTALETLKTGFDRGDNPGAEKHYWLRVPADVDSLDLEFNAAEIFFDYNTAEDKSSVVSPVRITRSYGQEETDYSTGNVEGSEFYSRMYPLAGNKSGNVIPTNDSWNNSAYSRWSVTNITLKPSFEEGGDYRYNDITITVTPPSGDKDKITTYTFHVQRLTEPTLTQAPGNTPMGMIARDTGGETEFNRDGAKSFFKDNYKFSMERDDKGLSLFPRSTVNNSGTIFRDRYSPYAWDKSGSEEKNIDLDPEAIVVYQNSAFKDPGITLTDSEGRSVTIGGDKGWTVYRKLKLKTADKLSISNLTKGTECWYKGGELVDKDGNVLARTSDTPSGEVLTSATDQINLQGLNVLPGIYEMEYELYDPVAAEMGGDGWYGRNKDKGWVTETGKVGAVNFVRTVVVLPLPGDVDMDGAVTSADAEILRKYLVNESESDTSGNTKITTTLNGTELGKNSTVDLFAYRVANINHDDEVVNRLENSFDETDVDVLEALPRTQLTDIANNRSDYYYLPLPSEVEKVERRRLETNPDAEGAKLELVYLGKETARKVDGEHKEGYFDAPNGPWKNGGKKIPTTISDNDYNRMQLFDTMWVGVKLMNGTADELLSKNGIDTFTFSLVYDARYLAPTSVLTMGQLDNELGVKKEDPEECWKATLRYYNMGAGSSSMTVWGTNFAYDFTRATQSKRDFATYDSKAITPLEAAADAEGGRNTHLRELVFSITLNGNTAVKMDKDGDQWLLAVPFTMIQHPLGIEEKRGYQGVEMQAGMSDFTLVFQDEQNLKTAAYNSLVTKTGDYTNIFGGCTENLAKHVTYANAGPEVPLGKDMSEVLYIRSEPTPGVTTGATDIVYSTYFQAQLGWKKNRDGTWADTVVPISTGANAIVRYAPDWLQFDNSTGIVSGRPAAVGTYNFSIANYRYELVVEQAPLHYWAEDKSSYYGETEFRSDDGLPSKDFTFRYDPKDIKSIETERAAELGLKLTEVKEEVDGKTVVWNLTEGLGADLKKLLADEKYSAPEFTAVDRNGNPVKSTTVVSTSAYGIISTAAQSSNYELIYEPTGTLTILRRPFRVTEFAATNVGRVFSDERGDIYRLSATVSNRPDGKEDFHVDLVPPQSDDPPGHYQKRPLGGHKDYKEDVLLPGDSLILQYNATLLQNDEDKNGQGNYSLTEIEETRVAHISGLQIVGGVHSDCYTLGNLREPVTNDKEDVVGTVRRRNIVAFEIREVPSLKYGAGDGLWNSAALQFYLVQESSGEEHKVGTIVYNDDETFPVYGVTVRWVTPAELESWEAGDRKDLPGEEKYNYHSGQIFTMDYNGRYLCLCSQNGVDEKGNSRTIVTYYRTPLEITPRNLVLTAVESTRFYGEENGTLGFTYDPTCLAPGDLEKLRAKYGDDAAARGPRDGAELLELLGKDEYTAPTLSVIDGVSKDPATGKPVKGAAVTAKSNAGPTTYVVLIEGAWSKNYMVQYSYSYIDAGSRKTEIQSGWGASPFTIRRRPIVVEALRDTAATENLATLYADTKRIFRTDLPLSMDDVVIGLPDHDAKTTTYYPRYGATSATTLKMGYAPESSPILAEDMGADKLSLEYRATMASQDGADYVHWTSFSKGHFNMDSAVNGSRRYPVQVWYLTLKGSSAGNYELVYRDNTSATLGMPARWRAVTGCIEPGKNARMTYYAPVIEKEESGSVTQVLGQGTVTLRPIEKIQILSTGMLEYTYGDTYTPNQPQANQRQGLRIHIEYLREGLEDDLANNVTTGEVEFRITGYTNTANGRMPVTTFDERGLKIYYQPGSGTTDTDSCQELEYLTALTCGTHNGRYLVVAGKRGSEENPMIWSLPSEEPLVVRPRPLTLRADNAHRVYGEANPTFSFTFDARELAPQDRTRLGVTSGTLDGSRLSDSKLGLAYTPPVFATAAEKKSPVRDSGRSGYPISLQREGSLENYELRYEPGTLYIYPRRVQIEEFTKDPIYTIYSDDSANIVYDNLFINNKTGGEKKSEFKLKISDLDKNQYRPTQAPNGVVLSMTGNALVEGDEMTLRVKVEYDADWKNHNGSGSLAVTVTDAEIQPGTESYGNYELNMANGTAVILNKNAMGKVQLRRITNIKVQQAPTKTEYNYGETLDLTGLVVNISYEEVSGAKVEGVTIPYEYTDQFAAQGLYVNYYPYPELQEADNTGPQAWANLRNKYYTAATGDHVTIAPTHDSTTKAVGDPKRNFAANGQYLVVTAQRKSQFGEGHEATEPVLVRKGNGVGELVQIKVNPRPLQFYLEADDKTYDATTQATGTLRFSNVFRQLGQVDATNRDVTDMVYPVTGANYEAQWGETLTSAGNQDFSAYIAANGYRFHTGAEGYEYGAENTMTFSFLDPNVAYATEPSVHDVYGPLTTKEVQVKGLRLAGADARNYVLQPTEVTRENASRLEDYLNSGHALPRATIQKAEREPMSLDILPTVEVDPNTNVVRVNYAQSISAIKGVAGTAGGEESAYRDELHFEYALQYAEGTLPGGEPTDPETPDDPETQAEESTLVVEQQAGMRGELLWWDERFYGGETVSLEYPEGYIPREKDIPTAEGSVRKGQVYAWAEEDAYFILDEEGYPGGASWPGYDLYRTERAPLDRDRVYWPVVRVAETHNYKASPAISSVAEYTPELIQAVLDAQAALRDAAGDQDKLAAAQERMAQAAQAVMAAMGEAEAAARLAAQEESQEATEKGKWPQNWSGKAPAAAVKTYAQRLELISMAEMEGEVLPEESPEEPETRAAAKEKGEKYRIPTLEAVWFTDILEYEKQRLLDVVVRNQSPVRYQDYAWDSLMSAPLFSGGEVLSLKEPFQVSVTEKDEEGNQLTEEVWVNQDNTARIYVELKKVPQGGGGGSVPVSRLKIDSDDLTVLLGADPIRLRAIITPTGAYTRMVTWSSSDEAVAMVDRDGVVTFVGVGVAVITATSVEGLLTENLSDSITVTVHPKDGGPESQPGSIFNIEIVERFFRLEEGDMFFHPQWEMTRGETAVLLTRFYIENPNWTRTGPETFPDLTGEESYAAAARLLGSLGVVMGLPDGRFGGGQSITRAEFVVLLARMLGIEIPDTTGEPHAFLDTGEEDTWAYREIDAIRKLPGFILGTGEGYFSPSRPITRSEAAVFLTRLLRFPQVGENPVIPQDVGESHWARSSILRAVNQGKTLEE